MELPPSDLVKGQVRVGEGDGDATPHLIKKRNPEEVLKDGHRPGPIVKFDASRFEKGLLLGDEFVGVHSGQADNS